MVVGVDDVNETCLWLEGMVMLIRHVCGCRGRWC